MMEYFYAQLSSTDKDLAMEQKSEELLDMWFESALHENGDELPNRAEEELLYELDKMKGTTHLEQAKAFYAQLEKEEFDEYDTPEQ